jgi:hypothetical protein
MSSRRGAAAVQIATGRTPAEVVSRVIARSAAPPDAECGAFVRKSEADAALLGLEAGAQ